MKKIHIKFTAAKLGLSVLMFAAWSFFNSIENAREMIFVTAVSSSAVAGDVHMGEPHNLGKLSKKD